jgi:hypothetical protein
MKENRLPKLLVMAACALVATISLAQTTTVTQVAPAAGLTTTTGSFVAAPGEEYFTFRAGTAEPARYYYTKETTVVDPTGHIVMWKDIRPETAATVEYVREGDRVIVKKVVLARPVIIENTTTTTTTTSP